MNISLLRTIRTVVRADSDPARQAMFATFMRTKFVVRLAVTVHGVLGRSWMGSTFVSLYGLMTFLGTVGPKNGGLLLTVAVHTNSRRETNRVAGWFDPGAVGRVRTGRSALLRPSVIGRVLVLLTSGRSLRRAWRLAHRANKRYDFLVSCRIASLLASYTRALRILGKSRWQAVVVSSDTNPDELAFCAAAGKLGVPTVFIAHTYPNPFSPPLNFSLSILESDKAVEMRRRQGPIRGEIFLGGLAGPAGAVDPHRFERSSPTIGVFAPKAISWPALSQVIDDCRRLFAPARLIVRWHPSMLGRVDTGFTTAPDLEQASGLAPLDEVTARCDWVLADENSNVHLPVLKQGIPTVAIRNLSTSAGGRSDVYGFFADRVVYPPVDTLDQLVVRDLVAFYSGDWQTRFGRYDASAGMDPGTVVTEGRAAILRVTGRGKGPPRP